MSVRVVVDHVAGSRRGQRQEFSAGVRLRFGRHPECEVSFDPQRDISTDYALISIGVGAALIALIYLILT